MQEDTSKPSADEMGLTLEQLIRRGAKQIVQGAIEAELPELLAQYANVRTLSGATAVVRNGYLPPREILTPVGPVEVRVPKVRDRSGAVPAPVVWTPFCSSGGLSHGISLTGFKG